jgi:two-component system, OmpR family, sensor histidine kinase VicK
LIAVELRRQHQKAELFAEVTLKIRQSLHLKEILRTTVSEVQRILQADRVLIYQVLPNGTGKAISESVLPDFQSILNCEFPEEVFPPDYQALYARGRVQAIADVHDPQAGLADCLVEFVDQFGIQAKLIVPIVLNWHSPAVTSASPARETQSSTDRLATDGLATDELATDELAQTPNQLWGLLIAHHCQAPHDWSDFELELMQQLADQIGIAISQGELLEHLEDIVADRTAELRQVNLNLQQEITDRQQAETALRRSEEQMRLITNGLPVLIAYVDTEQRYQFNNQAYGTWLGQAPDQIRGHHLQAVWGDVAYPLMEPWVTRALAGEVVTYETEIQWADGRCRSVSVTYIPHQDGQGQHCTVKGFFALTSDISDRKAIERMKDEFIAVVSHELRTPLTSIHSALKILATGRLGSLTGEGQQMLEIADENTDRLVRLVNNVLDLQRIESGAVQMDREVCDAADLMVKAGEAMQAMAQQHQIQLVTEPVAAALWADGDYLVQALTNLISNAIKFSAPQSTVWLTAQHRPPDQLQFQIRDQGPGIPEAQLERIFERFHQVDSSDSRKKGGTGLGLTICRKIIEQHGGQIWAESQVGQGSSFMFTLPVWAPQEAGHER